MVRTIKKILVILILFLFLTNIAFAATLDVGPKSKYKTIQSAVKVAKNGDIIRVAAGTYKEDVTINGKNISFQGTKYPVVYGFKNTDPSGPFNVNGFKITKFGVRYEFNTPSMLVRNNYFMNCSLDIAGTGSFGSTVMNNQFTGSKAGISYFDAFDQTVTGNKFTSCNIGLSAIDTGFKKVSGNTFSRCVTGVRLEGSLIDAFTGNKYTKNKKNIELIN